MYVCMYLLIQLLDVLMYLFIVFKIHLPQNLRGHISMVCLDNVWISFLRVEISWLKCWTLFWIALSNTDELYFTFMWFPAQIRRFWSRSLALVRWSTRAYSQPPCRPPLRSSSPHPKSSRWNTTPYTDNS